MSIFVGSTQAPALFSSEAASSNTRTWKGIEITDKKALVPSLRRAQHSPLKTSRRPKGSRRGRERSRSKNPTPALEGRRLPEKQNETEGEEEKKKQKALEQKALEQKALEKALESTA